MNIQQFRYLLAVQKARNFGKAAETCFITQSTLSTMIAKFEKEIGILIFDRTTKPVTTTDEGDKVLKQLKVIIEEIDNLEELVKGIKGQLNLNLKLGAIPTIAPYLFPLFLKNFVAANPDYQFEISELPTAKIIDQIQKRELDIGIVSTPLGNIDLKEIHLYDEEFYLYDRLKQFKQGSDAKELDLDRLWILEEGHCLRNQVAKICDLHERKMINGNLIYKSGSLETLLKFVRDNGGLTFLPHLSTLGFTDNEKDFLRSFRAPVPVRSVGLIVHKHFAKTEVLEKLRKTIIENIQPHLNNYRMESRIVAPF